MKPWIKRTTVSLFLISSLAAPSLVAAESPVTGVHLISAPAPALQFSQAPSAVTVDGRTVSFDQEPVMVDDLLMVPVRAIAEAADAEVTWDGGIQLIHVQMPDRTILIHIGQVEAEMHEDGVIYLDRNRIKMATAPVILNDRTMISADALAPIFGFEVQIGPAGALALTSSKSGTPIDRDVIKERAEEGTIKEMKAGDQPSILLSGAAMANGEPKLTWVTVTAETRILVQEGDQQRPGSVSDLQVGAQVAVDYAGPLMMSYPARGSAAAIVIRK